jgi:hypothetical protein
MDFVQMKLVKSAVWGGVVYILRSKYINVYISEKWRGCYKLKIKQTITLWLLTLPPHRRYISY